MLDLRRLEVFHTVARLRSFSAAALALDFTQSSVSEHVATLERELGASLLDRSRRPVSPTEAGEVVAGHAARLLEEAAAIERDLAGLSSGESGTLGLAAFFTAWATFVPAAVARFARLRPAVSLELRQLEPALALAAVRSGELDLAVVYDFGAASAPEEEDARLATEVLFEDPYAVAVPAGSALARRSRLTFADLAGERWVSPGPDSPYSVAMRVLCREHGFEPDVGFETEDIAMAQPLVAAGLAIAVMPALGLAPRHRGVRIRPLAGSPFARSVRLVRRADRRSPVVRPMSEALRAAAAALERP